LPDDPGQDSIGDLSTVFCNQTLTFGCTSLLLLPASNVVVDGDRASNSANDENQYQQRFVPLDDCVATFVFDGEDGSGALGAFDGETIAGTFCVLG
jgi:hypothetical protein